MLLSFFRNLFARKQNQEMLHPLAAHITRYGYPNDETPDSLTAAGVGAFKDCRLIPASLAVSSDVEIRFRAAGIKPMDYVRLQLTSTCSITRRWDDRTAKTYKGRAVVGRCDIYCPRDENKSLDGLPVIAFAKAIQPTA
tara:strand:+ start:295 stop:711 length:417 start_codon:yes stop_codon:yes gene_type:complete